MVWGSRGRARVDEMKKKNKGKRTGRKRECCLGRRNKAASECRREGDGERKDCEGVAH